MAAPKRVIQNRKETCWAACMECWTSEAWYYPRIAFQGELAEKYGKPPEGGLDSSGDKIQGFTNEFWLGRVVIPGGQLNKDRAERWLEIPGFFMLVAQTGVTTSHAILVYDFYDGVLFGMNPDPSAPYPFKVGLTNLPTVLALYIDRKRIPGAY